MRLTSAVRYGVAAAALAGLGFIALPHVAPPAESQTTFVDNGRAGFVVTTWQFALAPDAQETGACPNGWTTGLREQFAATPEGARLPNESDEEYGRRMQPLMRTYGRGPTGQDACLNPEAVGPNAGWRTVDVPTARAYGIDLDAAGSSRNAPANACRQADFRGFHGETGIDNQFFRTVGCSRSYQTGGQSWDNTIELLTGSWGVLITLDGVDDIRNDNDVTVGIYGAADPIQLSPNREPIANATYAVSQDPRFRSTTHGRIRNGVLTTDPVDVRNYKVTNSIYVIRQLNRAVLQATIGADGSVDGYLAGYAPVEMIYDHQYGFRSGTTAAGQPSPERLRSVTSNGNAGVNNHTCNGAYFALYAEADGDYDPATQRCTSISTQYHIRAIPAFVVDQATNSTNDDLESASSFNTDRGYGGRANAGGAGAGAGGAAGAGGNRPGY